MMLHVSPGLTDTCLLAFQVVLRTSLFMNSLPVEESLFERFLARFQIIVVGIELRIISVDASIRGLSLFAEISLKIEKKNKRKLARRQYS